MVISVAGQLVLHCFRTEPALAPSSAVESAPASSPSALKSKCLKYAMKRSVMVWKMHDKTQILSANVIRRPHLLQNRCAVRVSFTGFFLADDCTLHAQPELSRRRGTSESFAAVASTSASNLCHGLTFGGRHSSLQLGLRFRQLLLKHRYFSRLSFQFAVAIRNLGIYLSLWSIQST